ncbi:MAG: hypothetical protein AAF583_08530 [Pseudomonadota bacterium]
MSASGQTWTIVISEARDDPNEPAMTDLMSISGPIVLSVKELLPSQRLAFSRALSAL